MTSRVPVETGFCSVELGAAEGGLPRALLCWLMALPGLASPLSSFSQRRNIRKIFNLPPEPIACEMAVVPAVLSSSENSTITNRMSPRCHTISHPLGFSVATLSQVFRHGSEKMSC